MRFGGLLSLHVCVFCVAALSSRDGWVSDVSAALTHCHAIAAARLADVSAAAQTAKEEAEKDGKDREAHRENSSQEGEAEGEKEHRNTHAFVLHARATALNEELAVLTARRQKTRDYITVSYYLIG